MLHTTKQLVLGVGIGAGLMILVIIGGWLLISNVSFSPTELLENNGLSGAETGEFLDAFVPTEVSDVATQFDDVVNGVMDTVAPSPEPDLAEPFPTPEGAPTFLSDSQRAALEAIGIDTGTLPTTLTPELESCFVEAIGRERVDAIIAGDTPSFMEMLAAKPCLI